MNFLLNESEFASSSIRRKSYAVKVLLSHFLEQLNAARFATSNAAGTSRPVVCHDSVFPLSFLSPIPSGFVPIRNKFSAFHEIYRNFTFPINANRRKQSNCLKTIFLSGTIKKFSSSCSIKFLQNLRIRLEFSTRHSNSGNFSRNYSISYCWANS